MPTRSLQNLAARRLRARVSAAREPSWRIEAASPDAAARTVIDQVEAGGDRIKHKFEDVQVDREISPATKADIEEAHVVAKAGHDEIRDLKHLLHASQ